MRTRDPAFARHVGIIIRKRREKAGLSQTALAERLEVTYQQVQKYERGMNTLPLERVPNVAVALGVGVIPLLKEIFSGPVQG